VHLLATNLQGKALVHLAEIPPLLIKHHPALFKEVLGGLGLDSLPGIVQIIAVKHGMISTESHRKM